MEDQQLAGLIMWVFAGFFYLCVIAWLFMKWLGEADHLDHAPRIIRICPPLVAALALMLGGCEAEPQSQTRVAKTYGDPTRGAALIVREGCGGCHVIPGIGNAEGVVGPPLAMVGRRVFIAGVLRNSPEAMILWLQHPQSVVPGNAMPEMNLSDRDAADITAYLMTLQ
jgi:putative membrane protein